MQRGKNEANVIFQISFNRNIPDYKRIFAAFRVHRTCLMAANVILPSRGEANSAIPKISLSGFEGPHPGEGKRVEGKGKSKGLKARRKHRHQ